MHHAPRRKGHSRIFFGRRADDSAEEGVANGSPTPAASPIAMDPWESYIAQPWNTRGLFGLHIFICCGIESSGRLRANNRSIKRSSECHQRARNSASLHGLWKRHPSVIPPCQPRVALTSGNPPTPGGKWAFGRVSRELRYLGQHLARPPALPERGHTAFVYDGLQPRLERRGAPATTGIARP